MSENDYSRSHVPKVVALVVSFNRQELLQKSLDALSAQTRTPDVVLVLDNASTDDSVKVASAHPVQATVLGLAKNTGGAGGFCAGLAYGIEDLGADYVWLMDDDTIPNPTALEEMLAVVSGYPEKVAMVGSKVVWSDGREHPMNTPRVKPGASSAEIAQAAAVSSVPVRSSSFVSMLVSAERAREVGLPIADYFIWNDDFEYSLRLVKGTVGLASRSSEVLHLTKTFGATDADPGERFYYEVRNKVWLLKSSSGLKPFERVLYSGAAVRRWIKTIIKSNNKQLLFKVAGKGLVDGFKTSPRSNSQVMAGLGVVSDSISKMEATR